MTVKLKSNLYVRPVNIFPNLLDCQQQQNHHHHYPSSSLIGLRLLTNPSDAETGIVQGPILLKWINFNPSMDK